LVVYPPHLKRVNKLIILFINLLQCYDRPSIFPCTLVLLYTPVTFLALNLLTETAVAGRSFLHCKLTYLLLPSLVKPEKRGRNYLYVDMSFVFFRVPVLRPGYCHA
jgi:hypothetical protein